MRAALFIAIYVFFPVNLFARIGENESQCNTRYGSQSTNQDTRKSDAARPLFTIGNTRTFLYQGWRIQFAYPAFNAPAIKAVYRKISTANLRITEQEFAALLKTYTGPDQTWKEITHANPATPNQAAANALATLIKVDERKFLRNDGLLLEQDAGRFQITITTPECQEMERALKMQKEESKAKAIPSF